VLGATFLDPLFDFLYPGQCAGCTTAYDRAGILCRDCERDLENLSAAATCEFCAMPLTEHGAPCPYCLDKGVFPFDRIISIGVYQHPLRSLIHQAKYSGDWSLAESLADRILEREETKTLLTETECLVPVPLYRSRHVQRGYNQAEVIARRLGKRCSVKVVNAAARCRPTRTQTYIHSRAQRMENLQDAFALIRPGKIAGKHIVLVDDVMTSGATLLSLAKVLRPAKPASISAIVIATADPRGRDFEVI
jgi:ComF family protein